MAIAERDAIHKAMLAMIGEPKEFKVKSGGDLLVHTTDLSQQAKLLKIVNLAGRPTSCSLPNRSKESKVGVLNGQNETHVKRLPMSIPNPYRCRKCWRLGHTATKCNANETNCKKCGNQHPGHLDCSTRCINCGSNAHEADNYTACPAYIEVKRIIEMVALEGIAVNEARTRYSSSYSSTVRRAVTPPLQSSSYTTTPPQLTTPFPPNQEIAVLQKQIQVLQEQVKAITMTAIPQIQ
ncbi:hypothetical protein OUZ56_010652 [Daphnia magna]|uniref:Uncharacterized protein n=1 Tax=Daphnia magna TaxID=35525 RepID=A0ABR0AJ59_9CRUS|nr:hypothetical protein OUZ56_010652 [Daphnia magna]